MNIKDPESLEYDPDNDHIYVMSRLNKLIAETTRDGTLIRTIGINAAGSDTPSGLAYAPASNNSGAKNFYIIDRGVDFGINPSAYNDGKMYEMSFPHLGAVPPASVTISGFNPGAINVSLPFTATVSPATTTLPLTYTWTSAGQTTVTHANVSNIKDTVNFTWNSAGLKTVNVSVNNGQNPPVSHSFDILIKTPPATVNLSGPSTGAPSTSYTFTANTTSGPTLPLTYTWKATDKAPVTHSANLSDVVAFTWATPGIKVITVTVTNGAGAPVQDTTQIQILAPGVSLPFYLPLIVKN
jgi:hypothetical protein